jgi:hypothetical protein
MLPKSRLASYRTAVDDLTREAADRLGPSDLLSAERLVTERLGHPDFMPVLSRLEGGVDAVVARVASEIRNYRPSTRSSANDLPTFIRILLLCQIDSAWWSGSPPFVTDADVLHSNELVDLMPLRSAKMLQFQYRAQPDGLPGRARDWAQRRALPALRPRTAGLRFTRSRPVVVAVVNQIAGELAAALPPRTPRLWVTSMVRSVQHQHRLRSLGYAAVLPSSHCAGYACDVEMNWFRQFDQEGLLARLLLDRQEAGQLNVIDEGQAWHLCINPLAHDELQAAYNAQLTGITT